MAIAGAAAFAALMAVTAGSAGSPPDAAPSGTGATANGTRFYVAEFDGLPQAQMVLKVVGDRIDLINFAVRMECEGPNTRLSAGFSRIRVAVDGAFSRTRDLGDFRGFMKVAGTLDRQGGSGGLHANLKGFEFDPDARSCRTGQTHWTASRVSFKQFDTVNRDIRNLPPRD